MKPISVQPSGPTLNPSSLTNQHLPTDPFLPRPQTQEEKARVTKFDSAPDAFPPTATVFARRITELYVLQPGFTPGHCFQAICQSYQDEVLESPPQRSSIFAVLDQFKAWCLAQGFIVREMVGPQSASLMATVFAQGPAETLVNEAWIRSATLPLLLQHI